MEDKQLQHQQVDFKNKIQLNTRISILLDNINSPANLGSIYRNAEAFGVETIWINKNNKPDLESNRFKRTSRSTENSTITEFYNDPISIFKDFEGVKIGLEITEKSEGITNLALEAFEDILLVLGNERQGISDEILKHLDRVYHINMFGSNSSLNVSQTLGIALYEIRRGKI